MICELTRILGVRDEHGFGQWGVSCMLPGPVDGEWLKSLIGEDDFNCYLADGTLTHGS